MAGEQDALDVIILGAGLAGLTAAYELRDLNIAVLEREDRVGGRTLSGEWEGYWYNEGAQFVWDERTLQYCRDLGVDYMDANGARSAIYLRGRLTQAPNPYLLLLKMPISIGEKIDFAWNITRLTRLSSRLRSLDRYEMDSRSVADLIPKASSATKEVLNQVTESSAGLPLDQVSGYIGLGYALHLFGGDVNDTLKGVVGGTQQITKSMHSAVGRDRVHLGCQVRSVIQEEGGVSVRYVQDGDERTLRARACICTLPAGPTLQVVPDLPPDKREALERKLPYGRVLITIWLTNETGPMPWDGLLAVPVIGKSFDLVNNHAFFLRKQESERRPRGVLATLSTLGNAGALWDLPDEEVQFRVKRELQEVFPGTEDVFGQAVIHRWDALPLFRKGALRDQDAIRRPHGPVHFAGDYTAQPGTPGAVGSGYYAARAVRQQLQGDS